MFVLAYVLLGYSLAQTTLLPALPQITKDLDATPGDAAWLLSGFFLSAAVATPILSRLGDVYGRRRMTIVATLAFGLGAAVVAATSNLWVAVGGRVIQGLGAAVFPLCFSIVRDLYPPGETARNVGLLSGMNGFGAALGLVLGGVVTDHISYHWIFWLNALMALSGCVLLRALVPESRARQGEPIDVRGAVVLATGLATFLLGISRAADWGWGSPRTLGLLAAGLLMLVAWTRLELHTAHPLVDVTQLRRPPVLLTNIATLFIGYGMLASFVLLAPLGEAPGSTGYGLGLSATGVALVILPGALAMTIMGPVSGSWGARQGNKLPLTAGSALVAIGFVSLAVAHGTVAAVVVGSIIVSAGVALAYAALTNLIIDTSDPTATGEATGFNAVALRVGMSLGSQVSATILAGSIVAGQSYPSNKAFTVAFAAAALLGGAAGVIAVLTPAPSRPSRLRGRDDVALVAAAKDL